MEKMLVELEAIRKSSEVVKGIVTAYGNGKEVLGVEEKDTVAIEWCKTHGYWVVNNFISGKPVGLGL